VYTSYTFWKNWLENINFRVELCTHRTLFGAMGLFGKKNRG
jgi:hypothetical protein